MCNLHLWWYGKKALEIKTPKLPKATRVPRTRPGRYVSVDQMEFWEEGFIAQLKGKLTKQRYEYDTIFVDQFSDLSDAHLKRSINSSETFWRQIGLWSIC